MPIHTWVPIIAASTTTASLVIVRLQEINRLSAAKIDKRQHHTVCRFCHALIPFVTSPSGAARATVSHRHFHRDPVYHTTFHDSMLTGFTLPQAHQKSSSSSQPICAIPLTPFFIVESQNSDKLPKLNRVDILELRRSFFHDPLARTSRALSPFHSNSSAFDLH